MIRRATLVTDGSSDRALLPIVRWLLDQMTESPPDVIWADLRQLPDRTTSLRERLRAAVDLHPCELLIVHRDAERDSIDKRQGEIQSGNTTGPRAACLVPVRMTEAWLLFDEAAIRRAADRPTSTRPLQLPDARQWESLPDPKSVLHTALETAGDVSARRARTFRVERRVHRLAELIDDWSPLRALASFQAFETSLEAALGHREA